MLIGMWTVLFSREQEEQGGKEYRVKLNNGKNSFEGEGLGEMRIYITLTLSAWFLKS